MLETLLEQTISSKLRSEVAADELFPRLSVVNERAKGHRRIAMHCSSAANRRCVLVIVPTARATDKPPLMTSRVGTIHFQRGWQDRRSELSRWEVGYHGYGCSDPASLSLCVPIYQSTGASVSGLPRLSPSLSLSLTHTHNHIIACMILPTKLMELTEFLMQI